MQPVPTARGAFALRPRASSSMMRRIAAIGLLAVVVTLIGAAPGVAKGTVSWHGCGPDQPSNLQCGQLAVPLDYSHPGGAQITLGFNRLPAHDRTHRVGSLIINPGGPGSASIAVAVEAAGGHLWHPALHQHFDLIGMDPRGIGMSTPVRCDPALYSRPVAPLPTTQAGFDQLTGWAGAFGASCLRMTGPLLGHVDTGSLARDMERLRRALGEGKLNFLGLSYGSHLGSLYAELYPKRIRVMALDGIANHSISNHALFTDTTTAYEDTFNRFVAWCAQTSSCALHGRDAAAVFDGLVAQADRQPIPAPGCEEDGACRPTVTGADLRLNALNMLYAKEGIPALGIPSWRDFASALIRAEQGDATVFSTRLPQSPQDDDFAALAINCIDYPREVTTFDAFASTTLLGRMLAPHTQGGSEAWHAITGCIRWPVPLARPYHTVTVRGAPPILLVSSTHDTETPYPWARDMHDHIAGSVLLTRDGDGHTSSWRSGGRTRDAIAHYLITKQTPPPNTVYPD
jgi:pimeloyl-ACP methyl ester carboxylesterase